jgi:hypothetical protein
MHYGVPVALQSVAKTVGGVGQATMLVPCDDGEAMTKAMRELLVDDAQVVSRALEVVTPREPLEWMALCACE